MLDDEHLSGTSFLSVKILQIFTIFYHLVSLFATVFYVVVSSFDIQKNFDGSNTDGSFTTAVSNSFLSPLENFPLAADLE